MLLCLWQSAALLFQNSLTEQRKCVRQHLLSEIAAARVSRMSLAISVDGIWEGIYVSIGSIISACVLCMTICVVSGSEVTHNMNCVMHTCQNSAVDASGEVAWSLPTIGTLRALISNAVQANPKGVESSVGVGILIYAVTALVVYMIALHTLARLVTTAILLLARSSKVSYQTSTTAEYYRGSILGDVFITLLVTVLIVGVGASTRNFALGFAMTVGYVPLLVILALIALHMCLATPARNKPYAMSGSSCVLVTLYAAAISPPVQVLLLLLASSLYHTSDAFHSSWEEIVADLTTQLADTCAVRKPQKVNMPARFVACYI
jgi:hypothetical protein